MDLDMLAAAGMDTADALGRVMGSTALLGRLLGMFLTDGSLDALEAAAAADDAEAALAAAHALKGVSGNLSMTRIFDLTARQCDLIRAGDWPAARALVPEVTAAHADMVAAIHAAGL